ncbi:MAG TPA: cytidine deaminase [Ferruginibacter sp.]|nr:cytidine deaminase [Ferruginibacter sp.]
MNKEEYRFSYEVYDSADELNEADARLVKEARKVTAAAYAPYSNFNVGAVAKMGNNEMVTGTNQENASYPVGICAERALLATAANLYPKVPIDTIAISYDNINGKSSHPISPCGMCRQTLAEYEERVSQPIRLILSGQDGKVYVLKSASSLLPLSFGSADLK